MQSRPSLLCSPDPLTYAVRCFPKTIIIIITKHVDSGFQFSVESNPELLWFCFTTLYDWCKNLASPTQPIRCKTKTNRYLVERFLPRFAPVTCICFDQVLIGSLCCLCLAIVIALVLRHSVENRSNAGASIVNYGHSSGK